VARDGTLVLACDGDNHRDAHLLTSRAAGKTWQFRKGDMRKAAGGRYVLHPAIVQRADGALLSFLRGQHPMPVLVSTDLGESWTAHVSPFPGIGTGQKAAALRLASGAILLCSHDTKKTVVGGGVFAALSLDDGKTWKHVRRIDGTSGYMSLAQTLDGMIYLTGTRHRIVAFNEPWLRKGTALGKEAK
jgi:hypothetical protein